MHKALASLCLWLSFVIAASGQAGFGSISGKVTDPSGAVVPNAKVIVINMATNLRSETSTDSDGAYQVFQLIPESYLSALNATAATAAAYAAMAARDRVPPGAGSVTDEK